jgi:hypothetical protein
VHVRNRKRGQIVVVEDASRTTPQDFDFTAGGGLSPSSFQLDDDADGTLSNTRTFTDVVPGTATLAVETVPAAGTRRAPPASDGSPCRTSRAPAETVTCTFSNRKRGQIVVVKDAQPDDAQDFSFTAGGGLSPSSFQLDDDADGTLSNTRTFTNVAPVRLLGRETVPAGWDHGRPPVTTAARSRTSTSHRRRRDLHVHEPQTRADRRRQDSTPTTRRTSASRPAAASAHRASSSTTTPNATLSNTRTFTNVAPRLRLLVSRDRAHGWDQTSATCDDGSPVSNIDVGPARPSPAPSRTDKRGQIVRVKDATPNDPQDFSFTAGGGLRPSSFQLDDDADGTLSNTRTFKRHHAGIGLLRVGVGPQRLGPDRGHV